MKSNRFLIFVETTQYVVIKAMKGMKSEGYKGFLSTNSNHTASQRSANDIESPERVAALIWLIEFSQH